MKKEFSEAAVEINYIMRKLDKKVETKIPNSIKKVFEESASKTYIFEYDETKPLEEQELKEETKGIIALLYSMYICNEDEQKEYIRKYNKFLSRK